MERSFTRHVRTSETETYPLYILLLFSIFPRPLENVSSSSQNCAPQSAHPSVEEMPALLGLLPTTQRTVHAHVPVAPSLASCKSSSSPPHLAILASPQENTPKPKDITIRTGPDRHRTDLAVAAPKIDRGTWTQMKGHHRKPANLRASELQTAFLAFFLKSTLKLLGATSLCIKNN